MTVKCEMCGEFFEADTERRRFCDSCRKRRKAECQKRYYQSHPDYYKQYLKDWWDRQDPKEARVRRREYARRWWAKQDPKEARARRREYQRRYRLKRGKVDEQWVADVVKQEFAGYEVLINDRKALAGLPYALNYTVKLEGDHIIAERRRLKQPYQLDIYIPELGLALDVRGFNHFAEPFGAEHLARVRECDRQREQLCQVAGIQLIVVDIHNWTWTEESLISYIRIKIGAFNYDDMYSRITVEHDCVVSLCQYDGMIVVEDIGRSDDAELTG